MIMKKLILTIVSIYIFSLFSISHAGYISNSLWIKRGDNISFHDTITVQSQGDIFELKFNIIPNDEPNTDIKVILSGLPSNLTWSGFTINSDTCSTQIKDINQQDNTFVYTFTPNNSSPCNAIATAKYQTNNTPSGEYTLSYTLQNISNSSLSTGNNSVTLTVNNFIQIIKAQSVDSNNNWYIEKYTLEFNQDIWSNILDTSNIVIENNDHVASNITFQKTWNTTWELLFDDGVFLSGETPNISITTLHNNYQQKTYTLWVLEDTAPAQLLNINGSTFSTNLPTLNPVPSNIVLNFSETLRESDAQLIAIKNNNSLKSGSFNPSQDKTQWTFTPSSNFSNGSYGIVFGNQVVDIAGNISSIWEISWTIWSTSTSSSGWGGGWWGWGWWGGGSTDRNYETLSYISRIYTDISELENNENSLIGRLYLDEGNTLTTSGTTVILKWTNSSVSQTILWENTQIENFDSQNDIFEPAYQIESTKILNNNDVVTIDWIELIEGKIWAVYNFNAKQLPSILNLDATLDLKLQRPGSIYPFYIYYGESIQWPWTKINTNHYVMDTQDDTINFSTRKFWYYTFIQNRYLEENPLKVSDLNTQTQQPGNTTSQVNTYDFISVQEKLLQAISNQFVIDTATETYKNIEPNDDYKYFFEFDTDLKNIYDWYAKIYFETFIQFEKYLVNKTQENREILLSYIAQLNQIEEKDKNIINKYVDTENTFWKPKVWNLEVLMEKVERIIGGKIQKLYDTQSISEDEYNQAIASYNSFVLNFAILKEYKYEPARQKTIEWLKALAITYKKRIKANITPVVEVTPEVKRYSDTYYFNIELKVWDYSDDVRHLQTILLKEWYFNYATTWYYGPITAQSLQALVKDKFNEEISGNIFTKDLIKKILNLPIKQ